MCVPAAALRFRPADYKPESGNGGGGEARRDSTGTDSTRGGHRRHWGDSTRTAGHESGQKFKPPTVVFTKDSKGQAVPRPVTAGLNDGSHAEIVSGELSVGDSVIVGLTGTNSGQRSTLPPGMGGGPPRR
jgi:hypothetical protein